MIVRRVARYLPGHLLVAGCILLGPAPTRCSEQIPYERVSRLKHEQRLAERDLARVMSERGRVTGASATALEAMINLRVIVHLLYSQALVQKDPDTRLLIAARADVLRSGLGTLDDLVGMFGVWERELAQLGNVAGNAASAERRKALDAHMRGIALLAKTATEDLPRDIPSPKELARLLNPVAQAILLMSAPERVSQDRLNLSASWPQRNLPVKAEPKHAAPEGVDVEKLTAAVQQSSLSPLLRRQMLDALRQLRAGLNDPKHRERAMDLGRAIKKGLDAGQAIAATKLIPEPAKSDLERQIGTALLLFADDRTRGLGVKRLNVPARCGSLLSALGKVQVTDAARAQLADTLRRAIVYLEDTVYEDRGLRLLDALDRLAKQVIRLHRNYMDVDVPKPFDGAYEKIRGLWVKAIDAAIAALAEGNLDAASRQFKAMAECAGDLDLILGLPMVLETLREVRPTRASALRKRLGKTGDDLADRGAARQRALAFLQSASNAKTLIERYRRLAYDRQRFEDMNKVTGGQMASLRRVGDALSKTLAARHASPAQAGGPAVDDAPEEAGVRDPQASLGQLVTLLSAAHTLARLGRLEPQVAWLERWRAWRPRGQAVEAMMARLSSSVKTAADQVGQKPAEADPVLEPVGRLLPLAEILVGLGERYGGWLRDAPEGTPAVVAGLYDDPAHPLTPTERTVMQICFEINEAGYAEQLGLHAYVGRHLTEARKLLPRALGHD